MGAEFLHKNGGQREQKLYFCFVGGWITSIVPVLNTYHAASKPISYLVAVSIGGTVRSHGTHTHFSRIFR